MAILTILSFSELPSPKIPPFSSISHSPALLISSRIRRNSSNLVARHRRRARRKNPPEQPRPPPGNDMSTAVQMPAAPRRWDEDQDHDRLLNSIGAGNGNTLTANNDRETSTSSRNVLRKEKSYTSSIKFFGVDLSPHNNAVAMVYFVQGVLGLSRLGCIFIRKMIDI